MGKESVGKWFSRGDVRVRNKVSGRVDIHKGMLNRDISWLRSNPNLEVEVLDAEGEFTYSDPKPRNSSILDRIMSLFKTAIIFCFFVLGTSYAQASVYDSIATHPFESCQKSEFIFEHQGLKYPVKYSHCSQGGIKFEDIKSQIVDHTKSVFSFMDTLGLSILECRNNQELEIYELDVDFLNDKNNFNGWQALNGPETTRIWALYDPRKFEPNVSSIILTDHGDSWNNTLFAHELSHYWYHRLCLGRDWNLGTEKFAMAFESYIKNGESK